MKARLYKRRLTGCEECRACEGSGVVAECDNVPCQRCGGTGQEPICVVCGSDQAERTKRARNALPADVMICVDCTAAIQRREVGISRLPDGSLSITDGREPALYSGAVSEQG